MAQDAARTDNQVLYARCDRINVGRANEDAKRIVLLRHAPWPASRLDQVYLAAPSGHMMM